ncbi:MAG: cytidine deaminase [Microbacteriaceae bacterium]
MTDNEAESVQALSSGEIDWSMLRAAAAEAMTHAYAPYSGFPVGAAALVTDGRIVSGCNVENASYGVTLCAECGLISALHASGGGQLVAFACVDGSGNTLMPCGRCRQLLYEHSVPGMLLETVSGIRTVDEVLPDAFGPRQLAEYSGPHARTQSHEATRGDL